MEEASTKVSKPLGLSIHSSVGAPNCNTSTTCHVVAPHWHAPSCAQAVLELEFSKEQRGHGLTSSDVKSRIHQSLSKDHFWERVAGLKLTNYAIPIFDQPSNPQGLIKSPPARSMNWNEHSAADPVGVGTFAVKKCHHQKSSSYTSKKCSCSLTSLIFPSILAEFFQPINQTFLIPPWSNARKHILPPHRVRSKATARCF